MESVADVMDAADSIGALIALCLVGIFALLWKYGGQLLKRIEQNTVVTHQAHTVAIEAKQQADHIAQSIITNHGSKNLGDAIDRISEWMMHQMEELAQHTAELKQLRTRQDDLAAAQDETNISMGVLLRRELQKRLEE